MKKILSLSIMALSIFALTANESKLNDTNTNTALVQQDLTEALHKECSLYGKVKKETHPILYGIIEDIANKLGTKTPSYIYIYNKPMGLPMGLSIRNSNAFVFFDHMFIGKFIVCKLSYDEVKAIIAHELSHEIKRHVLKKMLVMLGIKALSNITNTNFAMTLTVAYASLSRYFEKEADLNALKAVKAKDLISSLKSLHKTEKGNSLKIFTKFKLVKLLYKLFSTHPKFKEREAYLLEAESKQSN